MSKKIRILLVEDEPGDAMLLIRALNQDGVDFDWLRVETESEYLSQLQVSPDVILSDFDLPEFDAFRALELLQQHRLQIPFILVTGRPCEHLAAEVMKRGASDFLAKDRLARLGAAVRNAIAQSKSKPQESGVGPFREL